MVPGRRILAIDPGIVNLAWASVQITSLDPVALAVRAYGNEDVTRRCRRPDCALDKTSVELWDRLTHVDAHVIGPEIARADRVLLERQPPGGLGEVTAFFYAHYRDKVEFVPPRAGSISTRSTIGLLQLTA